MEPNNNKKWVQIVAAILSVFRLDNYIVNMTESKLYN